MSGDYVSDLRAFCAEWLKQNRDYDLIDHGFGAEHGGELTTGKLTAALDELERLRAERDGKPEARCPVRSNTRLNLQCDRPEGHDAAHVADLAGMGRFSWHGDVPKRVELEVADACDCECQPGQPCLCPERDCYCGPCRVCGENPQQRKGGD